ncbi:sensor histidine kinase [Chitinophaga flava]|nr:histidine kinase [Chitinophaga flava]
MSDLIGYRPYSVYYEKEYSTIIRHIIADTTFSLIIIVMNTMNDFIITFKKNTGDAAALGISDAQHKQAAAEAALKILQLQIDPHFILNSMSALSELILKDQQLGYEYVASFSKVYRYSLINSSKDVIKLEEELKFLHAYIFLITYRAGSGISFDIDINKQLLPQKVPPMTLQLLIENAQKQNKMLKTHPLMIRIYGNNKNELIVENNIIPLEKNVWSSRTGLINIKNRYKLLSDREPRIEIDGKTFKVIVPLLNFEEK